MNRILLAAGGGVALFAAVGCGGDPSTVKAQAEADQIFAAIESVASSQSCPSGGTVGRSEEARVGFGNAGLVEKYKVSACRAGSVTLDGDFEVEQRVDTSGFVIIYRGTVTTNLGVCQVDLTLRENVDGTTTPGGRYCGFPPKTVM